MRFHDQAIQDRILCLRSPRVEINSPGLAPKRRGRPCKQVDYTIPPNLTPKKRGRPISTPEGAAQAAAKAEAEGRPHTSQAPKKRGRPHKKFDHTFVHQNPEYVPFLCEWKDCPAELINLEILRNHIFSVHMRQHGVLRCRWANCKGSQEEKNESNEPAIGHHPSFNSEREFREHVNEAHLIPFAWHMGDGPKESSFSMSTIV
jgi:hypothetical protein